MTDLSRRSFLHSACAAAVSASALLAPLARAADLPCDPVSLEEALSMTAAEMARRSPVVQEGLRILREACGRLPDRGVAAKILAAYDRPVPTFSLADEGDKLARLRSLGLIEASRTTLFPEAPESVQAFESAPGSGWSSHHSYPGGLVLHTAMNVLCAESLCGRYETVFGLSLDRTAAVGAELLHDIHKPWVLRWLSGGVCRTEQTLAGTGEHHVLSVAESIARGLPSSLVLAQACAHEPTGSPAGEKLVTGWVHAASVIAGVDPVEKGLLTEKGRLPRPFPVEGSVVHLADHDWVIAGPACQACAQALRTIGREVFGLREEERLNAFRNFVLSQRSAMRLYGALVQGGPGAVRREAELVVRR